MDEYVLPVIWYCLNRWTLLEQYRKCHYCYFQSISIVSGNDENSSSPWCIKHLFFTEAKPKLSIQNDNKSGAALNYSKVEKKLKVSLHVAESLRNACFNIKKNRTTENVLVLTASLFSTYTQSLSHVFQLSVVRVNELETFGCRCWEGMFFHQNKILYTNITRVQNKNVWSLRAKMNVVRCSKPKSVLGRAWKKERTKELALFILEIRKCSTKVSSCLSKLVVNSQQSSLNAISCAHLSYQKSCFFSLSLFFSKNITSISQQQLIQYKVFWDWRLSLFHSTTHRRQRCVSSPGWDSEIFHWEKRILFANFYCPTIDVASAAIIARVKLF